MIVEEPDGSTPMPEAELPQVRHEGDRGGQVHDSGAVPELQTYSRAKSKLRSGKGKVQRPKGPRQGEGGDPPEDRQPAGLVLLGFDCERDAIDLCLEGLKILRMETERVAKTLSHRQINQQDIFCSNPECLRPLQDGRWVSRFEVRDRTTGVSRLVTSCSDRCHIINNRIPEFATHSVVGGGRGLVKT